jgi:hypothetical protein
VEELRIPVETRLCARQSVQLSVEKMDQVRPVER